MELAPDKGHSSVSSLEVNTAQRDLNLQEVAPTSGGGGGLFLLLPGNPVKATTSSYFSFSYRTTLSRHF